MNLITEREIILLRDKMTSEELRSITNKTKANQGYVSFNAIFKTMGYTYAFNGKWIKP